MKFHVFIYLSKSSSRMQLKQLVNRFGIMPKDKGYLGYLKSPEQFIEALDHGIYASLFDEHPHLTLPLTTVLQDADLASYMHFTLAVDAIFSPELTRLLDPPMRAAAQDQLIALLERGQSTFDGPAGYSMAKAGQAQIAQAGFVLATLEGTLVLDDHAGHLGIADPEGLRQAQRDIIVEMLDTVLPDYAFIAQQNDYELWHMGSIRYFPPVEPWHYLWSFMTYGTRLAEQFGRDFLEAAPAAEIFVSPTGLIHMQPLDFTFHVWEHGALPFPERRQRAVDLRKYLGVELPYSSYIGGAG